MVDGMLITACCKHLHVAQLLKLHLHFFMVDIYLVVLTLEVI